MLDRLYKRDTVRGMVPLSLVRLLCDYLKTQGVEPAEVWPGESSLRNVSEVNGVRETLSGGPAGDALGRFPAEVFCQWQIKAAEHLRDPLLGLHLGQTIRPAHLGALGYALLACDNLAGALARIERYHRLVHDINPIGHELHADGMELTWSMSMGRPGALFDETGVTAIVQFGRDLCGRRDPVLKLDFVNPPPPDPRPYDEYFGCKVRFSQPMTRLRLSMESLQAPLRQPDPQLLRLMETQIDAMMAGLPDAGDLVDITRRAIAYLAPQGMPELEAVANELKLSPRVFYRRLAAQGLGFRGLREETLRQLAETHLRDARLSLSDVGLLLGYSEQSAFTRAFKRWTGASPLQWRQAGPGARGD